MNNVAGDSLLQTCSQQHRKFWSIQVRGGAACRGKVQCVQVVFFLYSTTQSRPYLGQRPPRVWLHLFILKHWVFFSCASSTRPLTDCESSFLYYIFPLIGSLWYYLDFFTRGVSWETPEKVWSLVTWSFACSPSGEWQEIIWTSVRVWKLLPRIKCASAQFYPPPVKSGCYISSCTGLQPLTVAILFQNAAAKVCVCVWCVCVFACVECGGGGVRLSL